MQNEVCCFSAVAEVSFKFCILLIVENLLVTKDLVKIADFGLAREILSKPPFTGYVSTRWYRAPELLLHSSVYNSAVDMWAMGAIMAELFTLHPLFPGSSEADQLCKICSAIGSPNSDSWSEGLQFAAAMNYQFPQFAGVPVSVIHSASKEAVDLISTLCSWDPRKRLTAVEVLQHSFFKPCFCIPPSPQLKSEGVQKTPSSAVTKSSLVSISAREHSVGVLSSTRFPNNLSSANTNGFSRTDAQRNLETNHQDWQRENISDSGVADRDAKRTSSVVEKLADLKLNWNDGKQPHLKPCPVRQSLRKDAVWHRHAGVLGQPKEIPLAPTYYVATSV
ncbi:hypothetical protein ZIOFF_006638 [Zingiber officinale]|uniref:Protein kinase domain-containing protein n=1 Tax=Zingiber officinale TaxID=94328 RepID=A0A8J5IC75_ZINOF|nr:hypothetical protein ZIOFF_006638 [Zingiber officinale]